MNKPNIPVGWIIYPNSNPDIQYDFWKAFPTPDGLEVDIYIKNVQNRFEIVSEAASRSTEPNEAVLASTTTLDEALVVAYQECEEWDDYVSKLLQKRAQR